MLVDIFITTTQRSVDLFSRSIEDLVSKTNKLKTPYRLTVVFDGQSEYSGSFKPSDIAKSGIDYFIVNLKDPKGLGTGINLALSHINTLNTYFDNQKSDFICYCQDDILYRDGWLEKLLKAYNAYSKVKKLAFATGHNAPEHPRRAEMKYGSDTIYLKDWIRATQMLAPTDYWMSMYPISRMDPETGRERARPHGGMGSSVDWWFVRNHPNSVCRSGRTNLVYPGLITHIGADKSTWLDRALPEDG